MTQVPTFPLSESRKILDEIPFGEVETYWIELDRAIYVDDAHSVETRARAAGIQMLFSENYGPVFRTTLPVLPTESYEDKQDRQWHADEVVDHVEWLLSGTTAVIPRPEVLDSLKLLASVPRLFEGDSVPNTGAQLVEASLHAHGKQGPVYDLIVLYLNQISRVQTTGESAEETLAFVKEHWELGDVGAAEKYRERYPVVSDNFDWVAEAERIED